MMQELYSDLKIFNFPQKVVDILEDRLSPPIHIRLKPTNRCNHKCYYCCYRNKNLFLNQLFNGSDEIPYKKMEKLILDLSEMGVKAVTLSGGGEPLYYPHIKETVTQLINSKIKVAVLTNGSLLKGDIAEILSKKATWIRISMDALDSQTYVKIRKTGSDEFNKVCKNIYNFAKIKNSNCQLGVNFIVMKENYKNLYKFLKLMKGLGVNHVKISEAIVSTGKETNKKYYSSLLKSVKAQIAKGIIDLSGNRFSIIDKFDDFNKKNDCYQKQYNRCPFIQCLTVIGADMNLYTCQDKAYTKAGKLGSLKGKSFKKLWFSEKVKKRFFELNPSKDCTHHCTQHNKNLMLLNYFGLDEEHLEFV
ncbi:MAG: radical SAM protein [Candidatus Omnitrophica bacterium]|nr:radical SAM protein [Candidatus Omnitrophota bacterium]